MINMTRLPNGGARFKLSANFARDPGHLPLLRQAIDDLNGAGHDVRLVDRTWVALELMAKWGVEVTSMGRTPDDDPIFFMAAAAAGMVEL